ncbi:hypothetical protein JTE90_013344 [Oedothorax gibbosus]|uniref:Uncharacterized protein n=1 Tax=Oedothorax gibbosus TaxID=931172 RepID=A0AAV6VD35_9ARAC|nr:hypothetical protein JTE90_013344 [Oedothorax gibbosus]
MPKIWEHVKERTSIMTRCDGKEHRKRVNRPCKKAPAAKAPVVRLRASAIQPSKMKGKGLFLYNECIHLEWRFDEREILLWGSSEKHGVPIDGMVAFLLHPNEPLG